MSNVITVAVPSDRTAAQVLSEIEKKGFSVLESVSYDVRISTNAFTGKKDISIQIADETHKNIQKGTPTMKRA